MDDELSDLFSAADTYGPFAIQIDGYDFDLPAVVAVDQSRRVDEREPLAQSEAASCLDEAGEAFRDGQGYSGWNERSLSGSEDMIDGGPEIESGVACVRICGKREVFVETLDPKRQQSLAEFLEF